MSTHDHDPDRSNPSASIGYEITDVNVRGITLFLIALAVFVVVFFVVCFGLGKVINTAIVKHDGPLNRWNATQENTRHGLQNLTSNAVTEQEELNRMTQRFPQPRLEIDNGDQDITDLHAREDLLLDHYSWIDRQAGKVRIPIGRAMELVAQRGLPVAPQTQTEPLMMGDNAPEVVAPLTNGFARTGYEQQALETLKQQRLRGETPAEQASLRASH